MGGRNIGCVNAFDRMIPKKEFLMLKICMCYIKVGCKLCFKMEKIMSKIYYSLLRNWSKALAKFLHYVIDFTQNVYKILSSVISGLGINK